MAAGFANVTIYTGPSTTAAQTFYSSDGTTSGNLVPAFVLRDAAGAINGLAAPLYTSAAPMAVPSANFTRPNDTTPYTSGDLVANNTTGGSVTPLSWGTAGRVSALGGSVMRARLKKSGTTVTNAAFRLHLYKSSPTCTNGDNGAWLTTQSDYLGSIDLDMSGANGRVFSDAAEVVAAPTHGTEIGFVPAATTIYGLLAATAAYTPAAEEVFTVELEIKQN